jgi:ABC-type sugar transport system substrate-binding protein
MLRHAAAVAARSDPPDYIVIVNEKLTAQQMLHTLSRSPAKVLLIHNDLPDVERSETGNERGAIANWIGTITADGSNGSCRLMNYLCWLIGERPARVIAITGDPTTPISGERAQGIATALARRPEGRIEQAVYGDWSFADGKEKARVLLSRFPDANIIWGANDTMTLGALAAVREQGASIIVGGVGALPEAVATVINGELAAIVAGDQFIGACAMVVLYDYHHGVDFAVPGGPRLKPDFLTVLYGENASRYYEIAFNRRAAPDFSRFSRYLRRASGYNFDLQYLLSSASKAA